MSFPAARLTDMTPTADPITGPCVPTVLIGGLPAAVLGDLVVGPVVTGAITTATSMTVIVGGRPAARMTSMVSGANTVTGVPVSGIPIMVPCCPTVLIGG